MTLQSMITLLAIMGISLLGLSKAVAQLDDNNNPTPTINGLIWKTYTNDKLGISFEYPSDWILEEKANRFYNLPDVTVYSGLNSFSFLDHKKSIDDMLSYMSFDAVAIEGSSIFAQGEGKNIIEEVNTSKYKIDGKDTATFLYTFDNDLGYKIADQTFFVNINNMIYMLSYQNAVSDFDTPKSQEIMNHIINSFHFTQS